MTLSQRNQRCHHAATQRDDKWIWYLLWSYSAPCSNGESQFDDNEEPSHWNLPNMTLIRHSELKKRWKWFLKTGRQWTKKSYSPILFISHERQRKTQIGHPEILLKYQQDTSHQLTWLGVMQLKDTARNGHRIVPYAAGWWSRDGWKCRKGKKLEVCSSGREGTVSRPVEIMA